MMRTNIIVDDEEISIAKRGITTRCAVAAAIMNRVPAARYIRVNKKTISYLDTDRQMRYTFRTPPTVRSFIERWDREEQVAPIGFALTENDLISFRPPKQASTRARVNRDPNPKVQNPGSRMIRHPDAAPCAVS